MTTPLHPRDVFDDYPEWSHGLSDAERDTLDDTLRATMTFRLTTLQYTITNLFNAVIGRAGLPPLTHPCQPPPTTEDTTDDESRLI